MTNHSELAKQVAAFVHEMFDRTLSAAKRKAVREEVLAAINQAVRDEREACAKTAELCYCSWHVYEKERADHIAFAIRARSNGEVEGLAKEGSDGIQNQNKKGTP